MGLMWLEAVLPLGTIAGMLCVMGNTQYFIHKAAHGRISWRPAHSPVAPISLIFHIPWMYTQKFVFHKWERLRGVPWLALQGYCKWYKAWRDCTETYLPAVEK